MEEDYEDEEERGEGMMLSIGKDGKAELHKPEDWVEISKKDMDIIQGFIKENKELFKQYCDKNIKQEEKK